MTDPDSVSDSQDDAGSMAGVDTSVYLPQDTIDSVNQSLSLARKNHVCHFYADKRELAEILVPFFKEGLEKGEFCFWGADEPLPPADAEAALRKAVPDLDHYLKTRQIVIFPVDQLYQARFHPQQTYDNFIKTVKEAISRGFSGFRCDGNVSGVPSKDWLNFLLYESFIETGHREFKITAMCSYPLTRCNEEEILSVRKTHQSALIKRGRKWSVVPSAGEKTARW